MVARSGNGWVLLGLLFVSAACASSGGFGSGDAEDTADPPGLEYRLYVANESSDIVSRVVFVPAKGARVEREIRVGIMPADTDAPHGLAVSPSGEHWYVTLAHGTPDGWLWKFQTGSDRLVSRIPLGRFPASLGTTPDGQFVLVVNFNLHGDRVPSDLSVVYVPEMTEVTRVVSCVMPHGSRTNASGTRHYHVCMHSDQLVELDLGSFSISNRFLLRPGEEGLLDPDDQGDREDHHLAGRTDHLHDHDDEDEEAELHAMGVAGQAEICSPTWVAAGQGERANRFVYVACNARNQVIEIDVDAWSVTRRFDTGEAPYNLESSPDGRRLVVSLRGNQAIAVFDLDSGQELAELETTRPITHGVVISPDSRYAFVSNESIGAVRGTMDVFDLERLERVASIELQHQPTGIDLWRVDPAGGGPPVEGGK